MRLLDGMPYTPAIATDIRRTFARISADEEWQSRLEGALEVMLKIQSESPPKVTRPDTWRKK